MKKKTAALIMVCLLAAVLCGCGGHHGFRHKTKADDSISKVLIESLDTKWMYYAKKIIYNAETPIIYKINIDKEKEGLAEVAVESVNEVLVQEKVSNKISINFWKDFLPGASECLFSLQNFYYAKGTLADCEKLQCLIIIGARDSDSIYNDPETYKNFPDIRYLVVDEKIQKIAKEKGID